MAEVATLPRPGDELIDTLARRTRGMRYHVAMAVIGAELAPYALSDWRLAELVDEILQRRDVGAAP